MGETEGRNEADILIIYGVYNGGGMEMNTGNNCTVYDYCTGTTAELLTFQ